jgi:uncharacterized protein YjbI with pentapeptide repeats
MSEKEKQDSLFFKQRYVTDWGISLFNWIKKVGKVPLLKTYSFSDIISSKTIKKNYLLIITGGFLFGLFLLMIFAVWKIPQIQVPNKLSTAERERITLEDKVRTTLIQAIGGSAIFLTGCFALLNYQISQKKLELDKETSQKNLELADSKQITERFSKAVEQLGNKESIAVRLGGIYSLERIAKNSKDDHWTIMEVLTAFIREKSKFNESLSIILDEKEKYFVNIDFYKIPQDIQAALTVIGRRKTENDPENGRIDLRGANLNGANLSEAKLDNANLGYAELNKASFLNAHLNNANFLEANLDNANFFNAHLDKAGFVKANLTGANFELAIITKAYFNEANLTSTHFDLADLTKAKFEKATLIDTIFDGANLYETKFNEANIERASFHHIKKSHITANIENLTIKQILEAKNCDKALYNDDFWEQLKPYLSTQNE